MEHALSSRLELRSLLGALAVISRHVCSKMSRRHANHVRDLAFVMMSNGCAVCFIPWGQPGYKVRGWRDGSRLSVDEKVTWWSSYTSVATDSSRKSALL